MAARRPGLSLALAAWVGVAPAACSRSSNEPAPEPDPPATRKPRPKPTTAPVPDPDPAPVPATCAGLAAVACVERSGCILDQPKAGRYVCQQAKDACERAARHADIIGTSSLLPTVSEASQAKAEAACRAIAGCVVAGGKCSCPCAVLDGCNCACGGGFLARCVLAADARSLEGFPAR